jgi:uncharacterized damage-inducible protein DinB
VSMKLEEIHHLFGYNRWATGQILEAAGNLTMAQFVAEDDTPFGSIRNELVHLLGVQQGWIEIARANLTSNDHISPDLEFENYADLEAVVGLWHEVESLTDDFLATLEPDELTRTIVARFDWGDMSAPLWVTLMHVVNHGTQHRSEVAMMLTNLGHSPGMVDVLFHWASTEEAAV